MYVTLAEAKQHLNIEANYTAEDTYLTALIGVAEDTVERHICYSLADWADNNTLPPALKHAILLYVGELYSNREVNVYGTTPVEVPFAYNYLLGMFKDYASLTDEEIMLDIVRHITLDSDGDAIVDTEYYNWVNVLTGAKGKAYRRLLAELLANTTVDENGNITITNP